MRQIDPSFDAEQLGAMAASLYHSLPSSQRDRLIDEWAVSPGQMVADIHRMFPDYPLPDDIKWPRYLTARQSAAFYKGFYSVLRPEPEIATVLVSSGLLHVRRVLHRLGHDDRKIYLTGISVLWQQVPLEQRIGQDSPDRRRTATTKYGVSSSKDG